MGCFGEKDRVRDFRDFVQVRSSSNFKGRTILLFEFSFNQIKISVFYFGFSSIPCWELRMSFSRRKDARAIIFNSFCDPPPLHPSINWVKPTAFRFAEHWSTWKSSSPQNTWALGRMWPDSPSEFIPYSNEGQEVRQALLGSLDVDWPWVRRLSKGEVGYGKADT